MLKKQITDTTEIKYPKIGGDLLQNWIIKCNDKNNSGKIKNFIKINKNKQPNRLFRSTEFTSYR